MYFRFLIPFFLIMALLTGCASTEKQENKVSTTQSEGKLKLDPNFKPAVLIKVEDYNNDTKKSEIAKTLVLSLDAIISGDKEKFASNLLNPNDASVYEHLFDPQVHYRFVSFEIIKFHTSSKVHLTVQFEGNTNIESVEEKNFSGQKTFILEKNQNGNWKVQNID